MSRTLINFLLDMLLLVITLSLLFTSAVLRFVFPPPTAAAGWMLWGFNYDAWANCQFVLLSLIGSAIVLHVMLHWSWVCGVIMTKVMRRPARQAKLDDGIQTLYGVALLIVVLNILGALVGIAYLMAKAPAI